MAPCRRNAHGSANFRSVVSVLAIAGVVIFAVTCGERQPAPGGSGTTDLTRGEVVVYSAPACPWCGEAKKFLEEHNVPYRTVDVSTDEAGLEEMKRISGQTGVPVIRFGDTVVVGFARRRLQQLVADWQKRANP